MTTPFLRIGARGSPLSLAQTGQFRLELADATGHPVESLEIIPIVTSGDRIQDRSLIDIGGKGLFTKELDAALLEGRIDIAVHSMKDLPTELPEGIVLACAPGREDPRDAFICTRAERIRDLPLGARIGTASLRRQAQMLKLRPDFEIVMLRGNVETRLRRAEAGEIDATFLAYAGLKRLGFDAHARELVDPLLAPPAPCQGALAVTAREGDHKTLALLTPLDDVKTRIEISAERAFLGALDGSCRTPIGALGRWDAGRLTFVGELLTPDGTACWRRDAETSITSIHEATALGADLGASIRAEARGNI